MVLFLGTMVISCLANIAQRGGGRMFYRALVYSKLRKKWSQQFFNRLYCRSSMDWLLYFLFFVFFSFVFICLVVVVVVFVFSFLCLCCSLGEKLLGESAERWREDPACAEHRRPLEGCQAVSSGPRCESPYFPPIWHACPVAMPPRKYVSDVTYVVQRKYVFDVTSVGQHEYV